MQVVYLNGEYVESCRATVPITDRGFLFGDGVFTTLYIENGKIFHFLEHMERIKGDTEKLAIDLPPLSLEILEALIQKNRAMSGIWRMKIIITGGNSSVLALPQRAYGTLLITLNPYTPPAKSPIKLCLYPKPAYSLHAKLKTLSSLDRLLIKQYAIDNDYDDALALTSEGFILEASFSNIFWVYHKELFTPSFTLPLLKGIALSKILEESELKIIEAKFYIEDIPNDASVYICNCLTGIRPVRFIENKEFVCL